MDRVAFWFLFACVPVRLLQVLVLAISTQKDINGEFYEESRITFTLLLILQSIGFFLSDFMKRETTTLGFEKWWYSSVHGLTFLLTAVAVSLEFQYSFVILLTDLLCSILAWYNHHYKLKLTK